MPHGTFYRVLVPVLLKANVLFFFFFDFFFCCVGSLLLRAGLGLLFVVVRVLLTAVASLVAAHGL